MADTNELAAMKELVRGWLARNPSPGPPVPFDPPCEPVGEPEGFPQRPGPQPWNAGLTPGYEVPRADGDGATVGDLRDLAAGLRDLAAGLRQVIANTDRRLAAAGAAIKQSRADCWELANWIARVEGEQGSQTADVAHESGSESEEPGTGSAPAPAGGAEGEELPALARGQEW
jgi:hypothetical protein